MPAVFLVSDTHFGHAGVCRFTRADVAHRFAHGMMPKKWTKPWSKHGTSV